MLYEYLKELRSLIQNEFSEESLKSTKLFYLKMVKTCGVNQTGGAVTPELKSVVGIIDYLDKHGDFEWISKKEVSEILKSIREYFYESLNHNFNPVDNLDKIGFRKIISGIDLPKNAKGKSWMVSKFTKNGSREEPSADDLLASITVVLNTITQFIHAIDTSHMRDLPAKNKSLLKDNTDKKRVNTMLLPTKP